MIKKMDPRLISKEKYEVRYVAQKFNCTVEIVRAAIRKVGISRKKVYAELRAKGYTDKK